MTHTRLFAGFVVALLAFAAAGGAMQSGGPVGNTGESNAQGPGAPTGGGHAAAAGDSGSCVTCHVAIDDEDLAQPAIEWAKDVHATAGLGCESCHGGDPTPVEFEDEFDAIDFAMDPDKGFMEPPDRLAVPLFCARCHSDAAYMKRYNPQARVDQYVEYVTSVHGIRNAEGDEAPATCIDCHGTHGIRPVSSPESPAYATNVPQTCAACHADSALMAPYGISIDPYEDYMLSAHANALIERNDIAAPACNDCHGNHGATPPEVTSVANVCGQCHGRESSLFEQSSHKAIFGEQDRPACIVCHGNHRIRHPTPELFQANSHPELTNGRVVRLDPFAADLGDLGPGEGATAEWRVILTPHLAADDFRYRHRVEVTAEGIPPLSLDATLTPGTSIPPAVVQAADSARLGAKLSIEPLSGYPVEGGDAVLLRLRVRAGPNWPARDVRVRDLPGDAVIPHGGSACMQCHTSGDAFDQAAGEMYASLSHLDRQLRAASVKLRRAELAGMEVSDAQFKLKSKGTSAAVDARALIHSFDASRVLERATEGVGAANAAIKEGDAALAEVQVRRMGLAVSLVLILLVLIGLHQKIRQVDRARPQETTDSQARP